MAWQTKQFTDANGNQVTFPVTSGTNQVPFIQLMDRYSESWRQDQIEIKMVLATRFADRLNFLYDMVGYSALQNGNTVGGVVTNMTRSIPQSHGEYPFLYCQQLSMDGPLGVPPTDVSDLAKSLSSAVDYTTASTIDSTSNTGLWNLAVWEATFSPYPYPISNDADVPSGSNQGELGRSVWRQFQLVGEQLSIPGNAFQWINNGGSVLEPPARTIGTFNAMYKWVGVPALTYAAWETVLGRVNGTLFDGWAQPGTLLLTGIDTNPYRHPNSDLVYDAVFNYGYRNMGTDANGVAQGWNHIYRYASRDFIEVSTDGAHYAYPAPAGKHIYSDADHATAYVMPAS